MNGASFSNAGVRGRLDTLLSYHQERHRNRGTPSELRPQPEGSPIITNPVSCEIQVVTIPWRWALTKKQQEERPRGLEMLYPRSPMHQWGAFPAGGVLVKGMEMGEAALVVLPRWQMMPIHHQCQRIVPDRRMPNALYGVWWEREKKQGNRPTRGRGHTRGTLPWPAQAWYNVVEGDMFRPFAVTT